MVDKNYGSQEFTKAVPNAVNVVHVRTLKDIPERVVANLSSSVGINGNLDTRFTTSSNHGLSTGEFTVLRDITGTPIASNGFHKVVKVSDTVFDVIPLAFVASSTTGTSRRALAANVKYVIADRITTALGFTIGDDSNSGIRSDNFEPGIGIRYTGTGNLFESTNFRSLELIKIRIDTDASFGNTKGTVFDMTGNVSPQINPVLTLQTCLLTGWDSMGTETDLIHLERDCIFLVYAGGFTQTRVLSQVHNFSWESLLPSAPALVLYTKKGQSLFQGANSFTKGLVNVAANQFIFDISPDIGIEDATTTPLLIATTNKRGAGDYFKPGTTGSISGYLAHVDNGTIASVINAGGIAEFNETAHGLQVGQKVTIAGYVTNTTYNGTFTVSSASANEFELKTAEEVELAFTGTETTGTYASSVTTVTAITTGLADGDPIIIENTIGYSNFGLGYAVFARTGSEFKINRVFQTDEPVGEWNKGSLTETDERLFVDSNVATRHSQIIGGYFVDDNTTATTITTQNVFQDVVYDATKVKEITTNERTRLITATNGEVENRAVTPFDGKVGVVFSATAAGSNPKKYKFRITKDGAAMPDAVEIQIEIKQTATVGGIIVPTRLIQTQKVKLQVKNIDGTEAITIDHIGSFIMSEG